MSDAAQRLAERVVHGMLERDAFSRWLGLELVHLAPDAATVRMTVRPEMTWSAAPNTAAATPALTRRIFCMVSPCSVLRRAFTGRKRDTRASDTPM